MAARIAAYDWESTPLGPIDEWPAILAHTVALMLPSPIPLVLLWGEQGTMIYNDAYSRLAGGRGNRLLGRNVRDGWEEIADFNDNVMRVVLAGETLSYRDQELVLHRDGHPEQVWLNLDYSPVLGDDGKPAGVMAIVVETTEAYRARQALVESEGKLRFLDELSSAVAPLRSAAEVLAITCNMTAQHLGLSNCAYADMDEDEDGFSIRGNWHGEGSPSIVGHYRLEDFGELAVRELHAGRPLIINDIATDIAPHEARTFAAIGISATICMPLIKQGRLTALMAIHHKAPHAWSEYELGIIREVTERSWAHVQRVGAETTLSEREAHHRQILDSALDYGIIASDLTGMVTAWNAGAARMLGWQEGEVLGAPIDCIFTPEDCAESRPAIKREEALSHGRAHDARWHVRKDGERFWGLSEMVPLKNERGDAIGFVKLIRDQTREYEAQQALQHSEAQLKRAQIAGGVGLFAVDIPGDDIRATEEFRRIFGLVDSDRISAREVEALVVEADRELISNAASRSSGSALLDIEYRIRRADNGEERVIARKAEFEFDAEGKPSRLIGAVQDITDRHRIQLALEKSEAQFSALAQNMPNQVWTARPGGALDWFNDRVYKYCGLARGTLASEGWMNILHPDDRATTRQRWSHSLATGDIYEMEMRLRDRTGAYRWHLARAVPLRDLNGAITSWIGTNTEIEAQKQSEASFAADRNRLWTISQDLMLVCDFAGKITAVNPSSERLLGWREDEMIGASLADFVHPDDLQATTREVAKLSAGAHTLAFENRYRTRSGEYRLLDWTAVPEDERIHAIGRDITDQRAIEDALRQSQKMEAVGQLTGGIAHDFNNLLQGITGSLDIMNSRLAQGRTNDLERWLMGARTSAERAAALTHRLLAFSRRQPLDPRPVRANPLVASMEDMLRRTLGEQIELELVLAGGLWLTKCDPNQLESAILNLIINARDAMPGGGKLTVETCNAHLDKRYAAQQHEITPGQYVCICVTDTGVGMSKDVAARAFEPFFTTKPTGQGTGLGLSMIYGFARQSEGHARIYSEEGQGTTIKLYLPRFRGVAEAQAPAEGPEQLPGAESGEVVLVVEDEPVVRGLILEVLHELGYNAIEAADGPTGLAILQSDRHIDLLVTDIGLPGLNGRQVADGGRAVRPGLKVLFMTGYAENAALASGFLEPGMTMITKPFAMDALASRIRDTLEE